MRGETSTGKDGGVKLPGETMYLVGSSATGSKYYDKSAEEYGYLAALPQEKTPYFTSIQVSDSELSLTTYRVSDRRVMDRCSMRK